DAEHAHERDRVIDVRARILIVCSGARMRMRALTSITRSRSCACSASMAASNPTILAAAALHDTIEDTEATREELEAEFGSAVGQLVVEMTDDKSLPMAERKRLQIEHAPHTSPEGTVVKLSDKICNLRDMVGPPPGWDLERQR